MHFIWRFITPAMSCLSSVSPLVRERYGQTCAVESRSHMALMSPVITNVSGLPSIILKFTVVSSVLGKQFSNNQANSGSAIAFLTVAIVSSTALLVNFLFFNIGLIEVKSTLESNDAGYPLIPNANPAIARPAVLTKVLLSVISSRFYKVTLRL